MGVSIWEYIDLKIKTLRTEGRNVTAYNYSKASHCLKRYCANDSLSLQDITEEFVAGFNRYLGGLAVQRSTVSFYNRTLRAIYNQAVKEGLVKNTHPFDEVYTKVVAKVSPSKQLEAEEELSKDELLRRYQSLQRKYNTLVGRLTAMVGA